MLIDANVLLYAVDRASPAHEAAADWLTEQLNGPRRVGFPWQSTLSFLRIATHPRAFNRPLTPDQAWLVVEEWLASPVAWIPMPGPRYSEILGRLVASHKPSGNLIPDVALAALAVEHGVAVVSGDSDFARFSEVEWQNPFA